MQSVHDVMEHRCAETTGPAAPQHEPPAHRCFPWPRLLPGLLAGLLAGLTLGLSVIGCAPGAPTLTVSPDAPASSTALDAVADSSSSTRGPSPHSGSDVLLRLPSPTTSGGASLNEALAWRRSVRDFTSEPLSPVHLGQLLWAAQGVTSETGARTAPSAGGTYPLEVYVVVGPGSPPLEAGLYRYVPAEHALYALRRGIDLRAQLAAVAGGQHWVADAPVNLVLAGAYERTTGVYGDRGRRYVELEAGHAAQNVLLQATALGLGAAPVGAFDDAGVHRVAEMDASETPLYIIPVGHPR